MRVEELKESGVCVDCFKPARHALNFGNFLIVDICESCLRALLRLIAIEVG